MSARPAGVALDLDPTLPGRDLGTFELDTAMMLGESVRRAASSASDVEALGRVLVSAVYALDHDERRACVLVRAFVTTTVGKLPADLRPTAADDAPCLQLVATSGLEASWNVVASSAAHRALSLDGEDRSPMVAAVARRLAEPTTSFLVADPLASEIIPAKTFVQAYDVQTVFAFAVTLAPARTLVVIAFARVPVPRATARLFELVALYAKVGWLGDAPEAARLAALEELTAMTAVLVRESLSDQRRRRQTELALAKREAEGATETIAARTQELRRSQRAMLNVIEDLREARISLETTVAMRTRELAAANRALETRNQALEEFVYIASHDLQEPLRTVSSYLQMIQRRYGGKLGVDGDEFIRYAVEGAQRMQALIESLLVYSRVATVENRRELVPLDEALDAALGNLALRIEETHATIDRKRLPSVPGDRVQLVQLFQNLVGNALKFSGASPPRIHVAAATNETTASITVRDEGIGFDPRFAERIFKVFRRLRRDTPGTGIGLAVCKKIVERHGGRIFATSQPGAGATFTMELPLAAAERSA